MQKLKHCQREYNGRSLRERDPLQYQAQRCASRGDKAMILLTSTRLRSSWLDEIQRLSRNPPSLLKFSHTVDLSMVSLHSKVRQLW